MSSHSEYISEPLNFLLRAALSENEKVVDFYLAWRERIDFENISFAEYELLTKVYGNLQRIGYSDELTPKIKGVSRKTWLENQLYLNELTGFFKILTSSQNEYLLQNREPLTLMLKAQREINFSLRDFQILIDRPLTSEAIKKLEEVNWKIEREDVSRKKNEIFFKNGAHLRVMVKTISSFKNIRKNYETIKLAGVDLKVLNPTSYLFFVFETEYSLRERRNHGAWIIWSALVMANSQIDWADLARKSYPLKLNYALAEMLDEVVRFAPSENYLKYRYQLFESPPNKLQRAFSAYRSLRESYRRTCEDSSAIGFLRFLQNLWKADSILKLPLQIARRLLKS